MNCDNSILVFAGKQVIFGSDKVLPAPFRSGLPYSRYDSERKSSQDSYRGACDGEDSAAVGHGTDCHFHFHNGTGGRADDAFFLDGLDGGVDDPASGVGSGHGACLQSAQ